MSISYIETKFFHNLKIMTKQINYTFFTRGNFFLYQKRLNNHKRNGSEIKMQTLA